MSEHLKRQRAGDTADELIRLIGAWIDAQKLGPEFSHPARLDLKRSLVKLITDLDVRTHVGSD